MGSAPTLGAVARDWSSHRSPRLLVGGVALSVVARVALGRWSRADAIAAAALIALQPFTEWVIHTYVLHFQPRQLRGKTIDPYAAWSHRRHHLAPKEERWILIHVNALYVTFAVNALLWALVVPGNPWVASLLLTSLLLTANYEWLHWLIHTDYRPRTRLYKGLWRAHRLHHFRNERYWLGVTSGLGDRVLRTYPAKDDVPLSPTAVTAEAGLRRPVESIAG